MKVPHSSSAGVLSAAALAFLCTAVVSNRDAHSTQQTRSPIGRATVFNTRDSLTASPGNPNPYRISPLSELNNPYPGTSWPAADGVITDVIVTLSRPLGTGESLYVEFVQYVEPQRIGPITFGPGEPSTKTISATSGWPFSGGCRIFFPTRGALL